MRAGHRPTRARRRVRQGRPGRAAQAGRARADRRGQLGGHDRHPGHGRAGQGPAGRLQRLTGRPAERRLHLAHLVRQRRAGPRARRRTSPSRCNPDARSASSRRTTQRGRDAVDGLPSGLRQPPTRGSPIRCSGPSPPPSPARTPSRPKIEQLPAAATRTRSSASTPGAAAVEFLKQLRGDRLPRARSTRPGFLTEGTVLDELKAEEAEGIFTALNYSADLNNSANRRFAPRSARRTARSPTTYAMASYDAAQVLDKAIRIAGENPTPQQVNLALGKVGQIDSPRGDVAVQPAAHAAAEVVPARGPARRAGAVQRAGQRAGDARLADGRVPLGGARPPGSVPQFGDAALDAAAALLQLGQARPAPGV